jgi:hypothetical protein
MCKRDDILLPILVPEKQKISGEGVEFCSENDIKIKQPITKHCALISESTA